jgi:hypothetical protein
VAGENGVDKVGLGMDGLSRRVGGRVVGMGCDVREKWRKRVRRRDYILWNRRARKLDSK